MTIENDAGRSAGEAGPVTVLVVGAPASPVARHARHGRMAETSRRVEVPAELDEGPHARLS